jgi:hypothetical protein
MTWALPHTLALSLSVLKMGIWPSYDQIFNPGQLTMILGRWMQEFKEELANTNSPFQRKENCYAVGRQSTCRRRGTIAPLLQ